MEQTARAAVLAVYLAYAVLLRDAPILFPEFKAVAHFDRADDEISALQRFGAIGRRGEGKRQLMLADESFSSLFDGCQRDRVDVVQDDVAALQHLALEDIADRAVPKLSAARAN